MSNGIGKNPLNDISQVYLNQVAEGKKKKDDTYLEPDTEKRQKNNEKARKDMEKMGTSMKNPHFEGTGWEAISKCGDAYNAMFEDAKMGKQSDEKLAALHKQVTSSDQSLPSNQFMLKRVQKEMNRRKKATQKEALDPVGKEEVEVIDEDSRRTSNKQQTKRVRSNIKAFGSNFTPPNNWDPDANRGKGEVVTRKQMEKKRRKSLRQEGLDPVGQEDGDIDNDGDKDKSDKYLAKRRKAIGKAMGKRMNEAKHATAKQMHSPHEVPSGEIKKLVKKAVKRIDADNDGDVDKEDPKETGMGEFIPSPDGKKIKTKARFEAYSWRSELSEVITDIESEKEIKEKKVKNTVKINPTLGEAVEEIGGTILEAIEVDEMEIVVEEVYAELIEEGYSEDDVEDAIEYSLNEVSDSYYDSAVKASKESAPKKSMKDRLKSAAKKAIMGTSRAAGKAIKAKASVQAAPGRAKEKIKSLADRVKSVAKSGYESGRGPVEKKTTYRGAGSGRKEKIGEGNQGGENIQEIDVKGALDSGARMMNSNPVGKVIKKVLSPAGSGRGTARPAPSARPGTTGGGATSRPMMNSYEPEGDLVDENVATGKAKRAKMGGIAQKVGAGEIVSNKEKDAAMAKKKSANDASDKAIGDAAHKAATDKGMSPAEAMMRKRAAERKSARERAREMK